APLDPLNFSRVFRVKFLKYRCRGDRPRSPVRLIPNVSMKVYAGGANVPVRPFARPSARSEFLKFG
ncbi:MAG: hypothetical protein FWG68_09425, partial [Defluviitaleaceae bacterium]|nr:hypothetical protein [Defluviitaleaceae bacterium]